MKKEKIKKAHLESKQAKQAWMVQSAKNHRKWATIWVLTWDSTFWFVQFYSQSFTVFYWDLYHRNQ